MSLFAKKVENPFKLF